MANILSVKGKTILISGGTGVLGASISKFLAAEGAHMIILGRTTSKLDQLVNEIRKEGGNAFSFTADVTNENRLTEVREFVQKEFDKIDVLINAAGGNMPGAIVSPDKYLTDLSSEEIKKVMELNYMGTFMPTKVFLPLMTKENKGSIINISSMAAARPLTRVVGYASAKAAIDNFTRWTAVEFAQKYGPGVRVNAIAPGFFLTEQNRTLLTNEDGSLTKRGLQIIDHTPMARFGKPEDLCGAILWLCSDASQFVTGTIIPIDGGFNAYSGV